MTTKHAEAHRRMVAAVTALVLDEPFFATLTPRLRLVEDYTCKTAWTNGRDYGYNPDFVMAQTFDQLKGLSAHETMHCASGHPWRRDGRDLQRFNVAADMAINPVLRELKFELPEGVLYELDASHVGKSVEWIFDRLPAPPESEEGESRGEGGEEGDGDGTGSDDGTEGEDGASNGGAEGEDDDARDGGAEGDDGSQKCSNRMGPDNGPPNDPKSPQDGGSKSKRTKTQGTRERAAQVNLRAATPRNRVASICRIIDVRDAPSNDDTNDDATAPTEEEWREAVAQAVAMSQGDLPGALKRFARDAAKPVIDWRSALRRFAQTVAASDYSRMVPNRRYVVHGLALPSLRNHEVGAVVIAVDTSGSIDDVLLGQFADEIRAVADEVRPKEVRVLYADAQVAREDVFYRDEPIEMHPCGGGGTDFRPVFEHVDSLDEVPACVIYLTDMLGTFPATDPGIPTLWVTANTRYKESQLPFGELLYATT